MLVPLTDAVPETCGAKAGSLGALLRAGLPVPDGLVVPFAAYHAARSGTRIPAELLDALTTGVTRLGSGALAVRSSATGEDTAGASAAGQHESLLAVRPDDVTHAVRTCWASLHSPRATAYRAGLDAPDPAMAVLVQHLVDADVSGVMFVPDARGEETVIEASWGLGPSVVGGTVTPDTYRVVPHPTLGRSATRVAERAVADKRTRLDRDGDALVVRDVPPDQRRRAALDDSTAVGLASLGRRVAEALGGAQDIEWALADGTLWIVQARPVTAPLPAPAAAPRRTHRGPTARADRTPGPPSRSNGTPGSVGVATGTARIVRGPADFSRVRPGDVLVCPFTDPAWTPLLRTAAGVVTETGGVLSHAAIVARERRIPAVLGVAGATTTIPDGAFVRIDGESGTVDVLARRARAQGQVPLGPTRSPDARP